MVAETKKSTRAARRGCRRLRPVSISSSRMLHCTRRRTKANRRLNACRWLSRDGAKRSTAMERKRAQRVSDLSKRKRRFQATSSFTFDRFVLNGPCSRHGFEIDKNSRPFKTLSANRQIQDFFKVWKRLLKIQDLLRL